ncbi:condensation domain-containing protein [Nonomuraea sp. NPDC050153]|uniref:condensation domain-containing protein n=1 Tax=Nonomuraea sp. NPDC050153 TaxID=3364359 RepID=UPI0037A7F7DE
MTGSWPASPAQQGMWLTERAGIAGRAFHMPLAVWLDGPLDVEALREACAEVARRHPVLGGVLAEDGGELRVLARAVPPMGEGGDLHEELDGPVDPVEGPAARFTLIREDAKRHVLLFQAHHAVFDGESKDILLRDLAAWYGGAAPAPLGAAYPEVAVRQRARLADALPAAQGYWAARWQEQRELCLPGLSGVSVAAAPGSALDFVVEDLGGLAERLEVTRFEAVLAAFVALLHAYGNARPAVGVDLSTRTELSRDHVGAFVNELPVIGAPEGGTFGEFARSLRVELRRLYRHRGVPLARAVDGIGPRAALTPVSLSYRRRPETSPLFPGLGASVEWMMFNGWVRNTLHLQIVDDQAGTAARLQYNPALLDRAGAERIREDLAALLVAVAADPEAPLDRLPLPGPVPAATVTAVAVAVEDGPVPADLVREIQAIFAKELELDDVEADDDLFDLGGHSLTITQIMARARERFGVELSFEVFIDDATATRIAAEVARLREQAC